MIGWEDVYKVVVAMAPLYVALLLGYGSVKWWHLFTPEQCQAIDKLVCFFTLPLYAFQFIANADPFKMNYRFIAADVISKIVIVAVLVLGAWAWHRKTTHCFDWCITSFSLSTLTNALVIGVPLIKAMYGPDAVDLIVQASILQGIIWLTILLFVLEVRNTRSEIELEVRNANQVTCDSTLDVEGMETKATANDLRPSCASLAKIVLLKLACNPNAYASILGLTWAFIASRWHFKMPSIMEESISVMSRAATGTALFSMGLFMALQEKLIACGVGLTLYGLLLRFILGPAAMAIACIIVGLRGEILHVAIIQAAMPQAIISFIYAHDYELHANVLSTAVIFGTLISLPVLIGYYYFLGVMH